MANMSPGLTLGAYLRRAREEAGLSLRQLEDRTGVGRMALSRLENDAVLEPQATDLSKLARALELNETDLFLLAGLPVPEGAASIEVLLRKEYGVPDTAVPELKQQIEALIAEHGTLPRKPPETQRGGTTNESY